jgi:hypothetical protein
MTLQISWLRCTHAQVMHVRSAQWGLEVGLVIYHLLNVASRRICSALCYNRSCMPQHIVPQADQVARHLVVDASVWCLQLCNIQRVSHCLHLVPDALLLLLLLVPIACRWWVTCRSSGRASEEHHMQHAHLVPALTYYVCAAAGATGAQPSVGG